jgi:hypothetical protein
VRQEIPLRGKLLGTTTLFAPPQLADFDATRFEKTNESLAGDIPVAKRSSAAALAQLGQDYEQALYGGAPPRVLAFADACRARINGAESVSDTVVLEPLDAKTGIVTSCRNRAEGGFFAQVGRLRESRVLVADPARGIVVIATAIDHPGSAERIDLKGVARIAMPEPFRPPSTSIGATVISVRDGRIAHIETVARPVFYGMGLGWSG